MKQYIKYIVLFIILIFVGIIGVNLYNNKSLQEPIKNIPNTTINQNKDSKNSNTKSDEKEQTKKTTETTEETKKTDDTNNSSTNDSSSTTTNTNESSSTNQSSTPRSNSSTVTYSSPDNSNTSNQSPNNNTNTTQSSNNGYNILDVEPITNTTQSVRSYSNSSITTNNSTSNQSIDVSTTTQNNSSENDNIIDVVIEDSSIKNNSNNSTSTTKNSSSTSSSSNKTNSNSSSSTQTNNTQNNKTNNNQTTNKTTNSTTTTQATIKDGNIIGATGYGAVPSMNILRAKPTSNSTVITRIELNSPFRIIGVSKDGNWWRVKYKGKYGYVDNNYCLINLPDYIPSINYYMVEAIKNNSVSSGVKLSIYGKKLYTAGKVYNPRLEKNEFIVPVTYGFAKKILKVQTLALKDGYSLKIYDAYRPTSAAKKMRDSLAALYNSNATVRRNINYSYENGNTYEWGKEWFIAQNLSSHSLASAIDVSLTKKGETKSLKMPSRINELSTKSIKYKYGVSGQNTVRNDLYSSNMTPASKRLDAYMMQSGLTSLASEWWHFQDNVSYNRMKAYIPNGLNFQPTTIVSTK